MNSGFTGEIIHFIIKGDFMAGDYMKAREVLMLNILKIMSEKTGQMNTERDYPLLIREQLKYRRG